MWAVGPAVSRILGQRRAVPQERALLVGLTGIDGSGKSCLAARIDPTLMRTIAPDSLTNRERISS